MIWRRTCLAAALAVCVWLGGAASVDAAPHAAPNAELAGNDRTAALSFLRAAEELYQAAIAGEPKAVSKLAALAEIRLRRLPMEGIASAEGIEALAGNVARMKRQAAAVSPDAELQQALASEIRLAADAIAHPEAPIWHRYDSILQEDIRRLTEATGPHGSPSDAANRLRELRIHYRTIRTATLIHTETYKVERMDSVLRYAERVLGAAQPNRKLIAGLIPSVHEAAADLFPPKAASSQTTVTPPLSGPPWGWSAFMGVFIVAILSWAGWIRYRNIELVNPRGTLPPARRGRR